MASIVPRSQHYGYVILILVLRPPYIRLALLSFVLDKEITQGQTLPQGSNKAEREPQPVHFRGASWSVSSSDNRTMIQVEETHAFASDTCPCKR